MLEVKKLIEQMTVEEKASFLSGGDFWHTTAVERLGLPPFMMCDGPNGLRKQQDKGDHMGINESIQTVCFPTSSAVAASFDTELAERLGEHLGEECQREKVSMLLGPGLNMKRSPLAGRNFEYYSEDPYLSGKLAAAYVRGLQSKHISACPKHFAANNQENHRMSGSSGVDERTLHEIYLKAFEIMVRESQPHSIMCAYNKVNGTFCSENKLLLTEILRKKWGFDGFVVTDWGAGKDAVKGVKAGLDLVMPGGYDYHKDAILAALNNGSLTEDELNTSVERILDAFVWSYEHQPKGSTLSAEDAQAKEYVFARELAEKSAVLLKNEDAMLPLGNERVAFIGAFAVKPRYQGSGSSHVNSIVVSDALSAAKKSGKDVLFAEGYDPKDPSRDMGLLAEAIRIAERADKVIVFAGLPDSYESEGFDRKSLHMPDNQNRLISEITKINSNVAVVLHNGAPVLMPWASEVKAVLEMYLAGDAVGEATVDLLYGLANPSGKLAETFPACLEHTPAYLNFPGEKGNPEYREGVFIGYRYYDTTKTEVLFPFGHGLSYTTFEYSDLKLSAEKIDASDSVEVSVTVKNTGTVAGSEIVQLYVHDVISTAIRPEKELKGFRKVSLEPGESKEVQFTLNKDSFAYYETQLHDFYVEAGEFDVLIASSSKDVRMSQKLVVENEIELPAKFDMDSPIGDIMATKKGQMVLGQLMQQMAGQQTQADLDALGEGAQEMAAAMYMEMPLSALIGMGGVPIEAVGQILQALSE